MFIVRIMNVIIFIIRFPLNLEYCYGQRSFRWGTRGNDVPVVNSVEWNGVVEESISDSVSVDLGICNTGAIGNNYLVVAVQR